MLIRPAGPADGGAFGDIYLAAVAAAMPWLRRVHTDAQVRAFFGRLATQGGSVDVAELAGLVVGFAVTEGGWLEHLYLSPHAQGQGAGGELLARARAVAPDLQLHCFTRNTAARRFYEQHGLRVVDSSDGSRNEEGEPDVTYAAPVAEAAAV